MRIELTDDAVFVLKSLSGSSSRLGRLFGRSLPDFFEGLLPMIRQEQERKNVKTESLGSRQKKRVGSLPIEITENFKNKKTKIKKMRKQKASSVSDVSYHRIIPLQLNVPTNINVDTLFPHRSSVNLSCWFRTEDFRWCKEDEKLEKPTRPCVLFWRIYGQGEQTIFYLKARSYLHGIL